MRMAGWSIELLLERAAVPGMMRRERERHPDQPGRSDGAVEPGQLHHLDDGAHAAAFLADPPGEGILELDLGGGVGAVAELVLEPLQTQRVDVPSGRKRGTRKQVRPPGAWASTRKASHMGADMNHLCPVSAYSSPALGSARVVLARTSVPPCFSVIPMPRVTAVFSQNGRKRGS